LKATKERLAAVDDEVTDERAELVATAGLLDQNDKLRAQIQAEEKEKIGTCYDATRWLIYAVSCMIYYLFIY
jgi:hypothetical protein